MNRCLIYFLTLLLLLLFTGCGRFFPAAEQPVEQPINEPFEEAEVVEALPTGKPYIAVVSRDINDPFWDSVADGALEAAEKYGADFLLKGPGEGLGAEAQADILSQVIDESPSAICISPVNAEAVASSLELAKTEGITIVGLNSGEEDVLTGSAAGTVIIDNYAAGKLAASSVLGSPFINEKIRNATAAHPITIAVVSQYKETGEIEERIHGFLDHASAFIEGLNSKGSQIKGTPKYERFRDGAAVNIIVITPAGPDADDDRDAALSALNSAGGLMACFGVSQSAAEGILAAASDGADLDRISGKYKDLAVVGFGSGTKQKDAVSKKYFLGSVAPDSYTMGYLSVELAYDALQGDSVPETVDAGSKFYTYENIGKSEIARLLHD